MVEKIIVNPLNVRGHGNVVSSKTLEDFQMYNSSLSYEDSFYTMEFTESAITLSLVVSSGTVSVGEAVTCTATVLDNGVAVPNVSVRFFDGNAVLGTVESDSNGEAVLSLSTLSAGSHSIVASYGGQSSSAVSVTVNKLTTSISLSSNKASCYIDETFTLSGTLSRGEGYSVYLYNGTVLVDTLTTGTDGAFSKVITPSGTGSFNYSVKYNGDSSYDEATSSVVAVSVVKRTPSISISKSGDVTVGTAFTISGTLSCTGSVKLYENGSLLDTLTVTGGAFSKTITKSVTGDYSYYAVFDGDSVYEAVTSSTVTVTVSSVTPSYDDIVLTADDSILSYYDGDSTTLRAQLMDGSSTASVSGVTVEFFNGSTSMGTAQTDSNGVATKTYTSTGAGDVEFTAEADNGTLSSETYEVKDIFWYSNDGTKCSGTYSTGTDGNYHYITNIGDNLLFPAIPIGDFELSMKAYRPTTQSGRILLLEFGASKSDTLLCGWDSGASSSTKNVRIYRRSGSSNTSVQNNTNPDYNNGEWIDFKLRFENGTVTLTIGGTSVSTSRSSVSRIGNYDSSTSRLSEMQIRTL